MTRAERKARTREELLDAAMKLFCARGFHATSLDLVAAEAGYTKGAVYSNFSSKEDLFFALYERRVRRSVVDAQQALAGGATPPDVARAVLGRSDAGWLAVFHEFWAHVLRNPALRERFAELHREARRPFVEATRRLELSMDAEQWTLALFAMVTGLSLEQLTDPDLDAAELAVEMIGRLV